MDYRDFTTIVSTPVQIYPPDREENVELPVGLAGVFLKERIRTDCKLQPIQALSLLWLIKR